MEGKSKTLLILLAAAAGVILIGGIILIVMLSGNDPTESTLSVSGSDSAASGSSADISALDSMSETAGSSLAASSGLASSGSVNHSSGFRPPSSSSAGTSANGEINVVELGADNTGKMDSTKVLVYAHSLKKRVYYPNGTYIFNGRKLDLSGGVRFQSMDGVRVRNSISSVNILNFDDKGNLIGLMQNHLEEDENSGVEELSGSLVSPPLSTSKRKTKVDVIAYWYNDFGLECIRSAKTGWIGWYYWTWNHHNSLNKPFTALKLDAYDPARHPLLGFYLGDKKEALDWQAYWLYEYGVNGVSLLNQGKDGLKGWENPSHRDHWIYQLFEKTPNFKKLKYVMNGEYSVPGSYSKDEETRVRNKFFELADKVYSKYDNYYYVEKGGKKYPVISVLEETQYRGYFNGDANVAKFYKELAKRFQSYGFGGFALYVRQPLNLGDMSADGVLRFETSYTPNYTVPHYTNRYTYSDLVNNFNPPVDSTKIISVATSVDSQRPHESNWECPGTSPALFSQYMKKAVSHLQKNPSMPQALMVYNVSEWAEGGPGLVPTVKDRFGYLEAIRNNVLK